MNIKFDKHGLITPKEIIELSLADFERIFVKEQTEKSHRQATFEEYLKHNEQIKQEVGVILFQFVNGSFTTLKDKPNNIDVVSFVDYRIYRKKEQAAIDYMNRCRGIKEVDGFIAFRSYPKHPYFMESQFKFDYWQDLFILTKINKEGNQFRKGLIKIEFYE